MNNSFSLAVGPRIHALKRSPFLVVLLAVALRPTTASGCSRLGPVFPQEIVANADLIVRAEAEEYARHPANPMIFTGGEPDSVVRFRVEEVLKGDYGSKDLNLTGYLSYANDFNELPVPYTFVRRGGRSGSCFANTYRRCGDYLLMLKRWKGVYTVDWYALGPTNEQLRSAQDPWLMWVRAELRDPTPVPEVMQRPRLLRSVQPACSIACEPAIMQATITKRGYVDAAKVIVGSPSPCTDAAMSALAQWGYSPASMNGQPLVIYAQYRIAGGRIEPLAPGAFVTPDAAGGETAPAPARRLQPWELRDGDERETLPSRLPAPIIRALDGVRPRPQRLESAPPKSR